VKIKLSTPQLAELVNELPPYGLARFFTEIAKQTSRYRLVMIARLVEEDYALSKEELAEWFETVGKLLREKEPERIFRMPCVVE